jgi:hypothetical protein
MSIAPRRVDSRCAESRRSALAVRQLPIPKRPWTTSPKTALITGIRPAGPRDHLKKASGRWPHAAREGRGSVGSLTAVVSYGPLDADPDALLDLLDRAGPVTAARLLSQVDPVFRGPSMAIEFGAGEDAVRVSGVHVGMRIRGRMRRTWLHIGPGWLDCGTGATQ